MPFETNFLARSYFVGMRRPSILMLLDGDFPPDIRVQKEAASLVAGGVNVTVFSSRRLDASQGEEIDGIRVVRMNIPSLSDQFNKKGWHDVFGAVNFFYRDIYNEVIRLVDTNYDAIHVHDLPLARTGIALGKKLNCPCVLDLHENYADGLDVWSGWQKNVLKKIKNALLFNPARWLRYEKKMVHQVDFVIASVEEMQERLIKEHDLSPAKTLLVSNTEYRAFHHDQPAVDFIAEADDNYNITYVGGIGPHRGVDTAIHAMEEVVKYIPKARLNIIGSGSAGTMAQLKQIVIDKKLGEAVVFHGKVPFSSVSACMTQSDINIIPHNSNRQTNAAIPHKLFQSMLSQKPTLVSDCAPLKRTIESCGGGWIFEADNPLSCAQKIIEIHQSGSEMNTRIRRAYEAASGHLSWESTAESLVAFYQNLAK